MGHREFDRSWGPEDIWRQYAGWGRGRGPSHQGPPPWMAGLFGMKTAEPERGPRVRRGDVRSAILDVVREATESGEPVNGYQVIGQIQERSSGAWKPSPGSVYPTIQQLCDEGLVETEDQRGRKTLTLTPAGTTYAAEHAHELAGVWRPFERAADQQRHESRGDRGADLKPEIGQVMGAVWQILSQGSPTQRGAAIDVLIDARRKLYGILADGDPAPDEVAGHGTDRATDGEAHS